MFSGTFAVLPLSVTVSGCRTCSYNDLQLINATFHFHHMYFYGFSISPQYSPLNDRSFDSAQTHWTSTLKFFDFSSGKLWIFLTSYLHNWSVFNLFTLLTPVLNHAPLWQFHHTPNTFLSRTTLHMYMPAWVNRLDEVLRSKVRNMPPPHLLANHCSQGCHAQIETSYTLSQMSN